MEERQFYRTVYGKYWENQTKVYGYPLYERNLVRLISQSSPEAAFEVGIGTGWPIGAALKKKGIKIDGCDLSESSVRLAKKELENEEGIWSGDVLEYKGDAKYDVTYCVRVSWLIPDFYKTIRKMSSMTKWGGYIIFGVMDKNSIYCLNIRKLRMKTRYLRFLGIDVDESFGNYFISIMKMKWFLKRNGLKYQCWRERELSGNKDRNNTPKVVFVCRKEGNQ